MGAGGPGSGAAAVEVVAVDAAARRTVQVEEPAPGLPRLPVTAGRAQQARITLPPVGWRWSPWPSQSSDGPAAVEPRGLLDQRGRHAGDRLAPGRRAVGSSGSSSSQPTVCAARKPSSTSPSRPSTCSSAKARAASLPGNGCRCRSAASAVSVRIGSTTIVVPRSFGQPVLVGVRSRGRRVRSPDERCRPHRGAVRGSKPVERRPVDVVQGDVPGLVADRCPGSTSVAPRRWKKRMREGVGEQRERAGVVGVEDRVRARRRDDLLKPAGDLGDRLVPRARARIGPRPSARPAAAAGSAAPRDRATRCCSRPSTSRRARRGSPGGRGRRALTIVAVARAPTTMPQAS